MPLERYICIHGHFYQPPRENPWLDSIQLQESAYPYHDWNERINAECYAPNAFCRMLDQEGKLARILNNYARISFNFGPTLLSWLRRHDPRTYEAIQEADRESRERFGGHGNAIAQIYNHLIMPLANTRDKRTQIRWGIEDFAHHFGRLPEGMWLAETAVDLETLDLLAQEGIRFTILSPHQAARVRRLVSPEPQAATATASADSPLLPPPPSDAADPPPPEPGWHDVAGGRIDPTCAYLCRLPTGRSIVIFFYDGPISQAIAFEGLLRSGEQFAARLFGAFTSNRDWPQLVHIATDGETYGHHHAYGEMALGYTLDLIERSKKAKLTNYGQYLELHPPLFEVEIFPQTAWSCSHGLGRWQTDCGCSGGKPGWRQHWRAPLRAALDWLRDQLASRFYELGRQFWVNPWAARDDYIHLLLDRSDRVRRDFFDRHLLRLGKPPDLVTQLKLLEMQRHAMLMYTSCGWFFDDISGLETVQCLQYAGRAIQLAEEVFGVKLEAEFCERLALAPSNVPEHRNGRVVYEKFVVPNRIGLEQVAAHFAVSTLFDEYANPARIHCFTVQTLDRHRVEVGPARLVVGRCRVDCQFTQEAADLVFAAVYFGEHNLSAGVRPCVGLANYQYLRDQIESAFQLADFPAVVLLLDRNLDAAKYSLKSLFRDEQRRILGKMLESTANSMDTLYRQIYTQNALMMRYLSGLDAPLPRGFLLAAELLINQDLRRMLEAEVVEVERVRQLLSEATTWRVPLDRAGITFALQRAVARLVEQVAEGPADTALPHRAIALVEVGRAFHFSVDYCIAQERCYRLIESLGAEPSANIPADWFVAVRLLAEKLNVRVPPMPNRLSLQLGKAQ